LDLPVRLGLARSRRLASLDALLLSTIRSPGVVGRAVLLARRGDPSARQAGALRDGGAPPSGRGRLGHGADGQSGEAVIHAWELLISRGHGRLAPKRSREALGLAGDLEFETAFLVNALTKGGSSGNRLHVERDM